MTASVLTGSNRSGFLGWVLRLPGPVWTLALWCFVAAFVAVVLPRVFEIQGVPLTFLAVSAGLEVLAGMAVLALGARTPNWLIQAIVAGKTALVLLGSMQQEYANGIVTSSIGLVWVALYVSFWFPRTRALVYTTVAAAGYLVIVVRARELAPLTYAWAVITITMYSIVLTVGYLVGLLEAQSKHDPLTGLLNRNALDEYLIVTPTAGRTVTPRTLVMIDLDGFKLVNDIGGHAAGDRVLQEFAEHLRATLRGDDLIFRVGGDEFFLLLPQTRIEDALPKLERLRNDAPVGCSFGAVEWTLDQSFDDASSAADALMYADKAARRRRN